MSPITHAFCRFEAITGYKTTEPLKRIDLRGFQCCCTDSGKHWFLKVVSELWRSLRLLEFNRVKPISSKTRDLLLLVKEGLYFFLELQWNVIVWKIPPFCHISVVLNGFYYLVFLSASHDWDCQFISHIKLDVWPTESQTGSQDRDNSDRLWAASVNLVVTQDASQVKQSCAKAWMCSSQAACLSVTEVTGQYIVIQIYFWFWQIFTESVAFQSFGFSHCLHV